MMPSREYVGARAVQAWTLAVAAPLFLAPRRWRFAVLAAMARPLRPILALLPHREPYLDPIVDRTERILYEVLNVATKIGLRYDPPIRHRDRDVLDDAVAGGRGIMAVSVHAGLNYVAARYLHDAGHHDTALIAAFTDRRIFGTTILPGYIGVSGHTLLGVREALARGAIVVGMCDGNDPGKRSMRAELDGRPFWLSPGLVQIALNQGAAIVFFNTRYRKGGIEISWGRAPNVADTANDQLGALLRFLADQRR